MNSAPAPPIGLEELDENQCFDLLGSVHQGHIALSVGAMPAVFPIHFALIGRDPVFRTDAGSKLCAGSPDQVVCLEVDDVDTKLHARWSVMVIGRAQLIADAAELAEALALPLCSWTGHGGAFVRIGSGIVSGRRIRAPARGPAPDERAARIGGRVPTRRTCRWPADPPSGHPKPEGREPGP